jgi:7-carboxy-7-deazaguanine synthase
MGKATDILETEGIAEATDPSLLRAFDIADKEVPEELKDHDRAIKMKPNMLKLSGDGTFFTLQGEGPTQGLPVVFLRLHYCNLRCTWCDAYYTWNPASVEFWTEPRDVPVHDVAHQVTREWDDHCVHPEGGRHYRRLVITGGEPLVQRKQIDKLIDQLDTLAVSERKHLGPYHWRYEIETNGTIMPTENQLKRCQFNCSPKLTNSDNEKRSSIRPNILRELNYRNTSFKFVCMTVDDLDEIEQDFIAPGLINHEKVIVMPQGVTAEEVDENMKRLYPHCMSRGLRLMGRLQNQFAIGAARRV